MSLYFPSQGAFWGMVISQILGISRFVLDFVYPAPRCGVPDTRPGFVSQIHPYYFSAIQMAVAAVLATVISYLTPAIPREKVRHYWGWEFFIDFLQICMCNSYLIFSICLTCNVFIHWPHTSHTQRKGTSLGMGIFIDFLQIIFLCAISIKYLQYI